MTAVATASGCSGSSAWPALGISTTVARGPMSSWSILALTGGAMVSAMGWTTRNGARSPAHQALSRVAFVAAACASATARCHPPRQTAGSRPGAKKARSYHVLEELRTQPVVTYLKKVVGEQGHAPAKNDTQRRTTKHEPPESER